MVIGMEKITNKILQVIGAIFVILIVGILLGVLMGTLLGPLFGGPGGGSEAGRVLAAAKTAPAEGYPGMAFISAVGRYTDMYVEGDSSYSIEWKYGWGGENAPSAPEPAEDSGKAPITFTLNVRLADDSAPDGFQDGQLRIFFEYDIEGMLLTPVGCVVTENGEAPQKGSREDARTFIKNIYDW